MLSKLHPITKMLQLGPLLDKTTMQLSNPTLLRQCLQRLPDPYSGQLPELEIDHPSALTSWWQQQWHQAVLQLWGPKSQATPHFPIEVLRWQQTHIKELADWEFGFRSSGTTQEERSWSPFSRAGLEAYAAGSLYSFYHVLARFFSEPFAAKGYSLIPTALEWPDSSLARMLAWIAQLWDVTYVQDKPDEWQQNSKPLWLFGTAFDFVRLCDRGEKWCLPKGSVIIETGGTKGKSRQVTKDELMQLLTETFAVDSISIVSEYGMCELASQAYEIEDDNGQRYFSFPDWVKVGVTDELGRQSIQGIGALTLKDELRLDCAFPIRTQDLVVLQEDGRFQLKARVAASVLKGCSLRQEELLHHTELPIETVAISHALRSPLFDDVIDVITDWLNAKETIALLEVRLGHEYYASQAIKNIKAALPNASTVAELLQRASAKADTWIFLGPQTHPFAILEPLFLKLLAGGKVLLRIPTGQDNGLEAQLVKALQKIVGDSVQTLSASFRFGESRVPEGIGGVLAFCDNVTAHFLRQKVDVPLAIFSEALTFASMKSSDETAQSAEKLLQQVLALGQKGCLSLRALWIHESYSREAFASIVRAFSLALAELQLKPLDASQKIALSHEAWRYVLSRCGTEVASVGHPFSLNFVAVDCSRVAGQTLRRSLPLCPGTLACYFVADEIDLSQTIRNTFPSWGFHVGHQPVNVSGVVEVDLGCEGFPRWTGQHQGRPYFQTEVVRVDA